MSGSNFAPKFLLKASANAPAAVANVPLNFGGTFELGLRTEQTCETNDFKMISYLNTTLAAQIF